MDEKDFKRLIEVLEGKVEQLQDELHKLRIDHETMHNLSRRDRRRMRKAIERLVEQEKSARGQFNFREILDILNKDLGEGDE